MSSIGCSSTARLLNGSGEPASIIVHDAFDALDPVAAGLAEGGERAARFLLEVVQEVVAAGTAGP